MGSSNSKSRFPLKILQINIRVTPLSNNHRCSHNVRLADRPRNRHVPTPRGTAAPDPPVPRPPGDGVAHQVRHVVAADVERAGALGRHHERAAALAVDEVGPVGLQARQHDAARAALHPLDQGIAVARQRRRGAGAHIPGRVAAFIGVLASAQPGPSGLACLRARGQKTDGGEL
ncbi:hypothetical protein TruAng_001536 [Truncatella angustata]|nr:hypothetical protein TruAng_001536 [Truncatella angustata]